MPQSALIGGVFIGVLSALPIINIANCCCLWVVGGGVLTAYLERQKTTSLTVGRGALLGLMAGALGAVVGLLITIALSPLAAAFNQYLQTLLSRMAADTPEILPLLEQLNQSSNLPLRLAVGFVFQLVINSIFATAGGAIGATWFARSSGVALPPLPPEP